MSESTSVGSNQDGASRSTDARRATRATRGRRTSRDRVVYGAGIAVVAALVLGWSWSIAHASNLARHGVTVPSPTASLTSSLTSTDAPSTAYLTDAALGAIASSARGASGKLRVETALPGDTVRADSLPPGAHVVYESGGAPQPPSSPGIRAVAVAVGNALKPLGDLSLITMVPFSAKQNGRVGLYYLGSWPAEHGARGPTRAPADRYAAPTGFIEVTPQNQDTRVSEHFHLHDFVTHDQPNVWPKYIVLQMRNVDKLELVLADLEAHGIQTGGVVVMSGFRTPQYNEGGGNTAGRAGNSRHMYGDAADIYIDNDHNGVMDDLNNDGRVDIGDSRVIQQSVDRVEQAHPELIGGAGVYVASAGYGPFIHIDSRGYRARWTGSGGG